VKLLATAPSVYARCHFVLPLININCIGDKRKSFYEGFVIVNGSTKSTVIIDHLSDFKLAFAALYPYIKVFYSSIDSNFFSSAL